MNDIWLHCPIVEVVKPACPHCGEVKYIPARGGIKHGDGSTSTKCICVRCSRAYIVVREPLLPNFGDCIIWPSIMEP